MHKKAETVFVQHTVDKNKLVNAGNCGRKLVHGTDVVWGTAPRSQIACQCWCAAG